MQYLGHKKLTTTQKYLKNVYLDDNQVALLLIGGAENVEEKKEELINKNIGRETRYKEEKDCNRNVEDRRIIETPGPKEDKANANMF